MNQSTKILASGYNVKRTKFGSKNFLELFFPTHYMVNYNTIHVHYLNKSHNSLEQSSTHQKSHVTKITHEWSLQLQHN